MYSKKAHQKEQTEMRYFRWTFIFEPEPGIRKWGKVSNDTWIERYPSGKCSIFKVIREDVLDNIEGTVVKKEGEDFKVFIPNIDPELKNLYLWSQNGEQKWQYMSMIEFFDTRIPESEEESFPIDSPSMLSFFWDKLNLSKMLTPKEEPDKKMEEIQELIDHPDHLRSKSFVPSGEDDQGLRQRHKGSKKKDDWTREHEDFSYKSITKKGQMTVTRHGVEFENVNLYCLELRGDIPLSPRTKAFLESRGGKVTQADGKITFVGDFFCSFSREEVIAFLKQRLSAPTPRL